MATNHIEPDGTGKQSDTAVDLVSETLSASLNFLPDAVFILNSHRVSVDVNGNAADRLGLNTGTLLDQPFRHFLDTGSLSEFDNFFEGLVTNGQNRSILYLMHGDGQTLAMDCTALKVETGEHDDALFVLSLRSVTYDRTGFREQHISAAEISDLKKTREALLESEHMHKVLTDNSMDIICQLDLKGHYTYVSPSAEKTLGYQPIQMLGLKAIDHIHPDDRKNVIRLFTYGVKKGEQQISLAEYRFRASNGTYLWFQTLGKPLMNREGETYAILMSSRDITNRKRRDEELLKFVSLVENSSDFIAMSDLDKLLIYINPSGCNLLGIRTADHVLGKPLEKLYTPDGAKLLRRKALPKVFDKGLWTGETTMINQVTGAPVAVRQTLFLVRDTQTGKPVCIATILQDIRERRKYINDLKRAKERAELADKAKSEFLANISHEIRTPLNGILGFADLLGSNIQDPKNRHYLENIRSSGQNLLQLINDILDLSKIESGRIELQHDVVDIHSLLREIESIFSLQLLQKKITFRAEVAPDMPRKLILDEIRIRQILLNLIGNAIKFTGQGYVRVKVRTDKRDSSKNRTNLIISVEDTGIGIEPSQQKIIFESFRQQSGQSNRKYGGTGLGLTITKRLTQKMGGSIGVVSAPGKGSTFTIRIPGVECIPETSAGEVQSGWMNRYERPESTAPGIETPKPDTGALTGSDVPISGFSVTDSGHNIPGNLPPVPAERTYSDDDGAGNTDELLNRLRQLHENDWERLRNTLIMSNARAFGRKLESLGISSRNREISSYAALLLDQVESFDVERLPGTINFFEKLYNDIKQKASI
ncbi:MAG: PAS domain-containing sensor histidine kinase [Balneolaceae bacterium]|nr:MAG: PAS domain-containing sensor histidine kinase [Balneolaceae bacterium]